MPPKSLVAPLKAFRDAFTEDLITNLNVAWTVELIPQLDTAAADATTILAAVAGRTADPAAVPADVLGYLRGLQGAVLRALTDLQSLQTAIKIRIPEIKEEDNLGVNVQLTYLKVLSEAEQALLGGEKSKSPATLSLVRDYLSARAEVEAKLLEKEKEGKEPSPKAPSLLLALSAVDSSAVETAALGALKLSSTLRSIVVLYAENSKKLINPRTSNDRMIH
jgi:hypothetical protein